MDMKYETDKTTYYVYMCAQGSNRKMANIHNIPCRHKFEI